MDKLVICYHGTNEENAKSIQVNGFKQWTYFATHLENALGMGGEYIFEVVFNTTLSSTPYEDWDWQFIAHEPIPADRIVGHFRLQRKKFFENILLREKIYKSNLNPREIEEVIKCIKMFPETYPKESGAYRVFIEEE